MKILSAKPELRFVGFFQAGERKIYPKIINSPIVYFEILTDGGVFFNYNGEPRKFKRGAVFAHRMNDRTIHESVPDEPYQCMVVRFGFENDVVPDFPRISFWNDLEYLSRFVMEGVKAFHDESCERGLLGQWLWNTVLWQISVSTGYHAPEYASPVIRALKIVAKDPGGISSVKKLAEKCGVSVPYFQSIFRRNLGITPHQYLLSEKLKKAKMLLATSEDPIKDLAESCGFVNIETFYRAFSRSAGMTPGEFRRLNSPLYHLETEKRTDFLSHQSCSGS